MENQLFYNFKIKNKFVKKRMKKPCHKNKKYFITKNNKTDFLFF